MLAGVDAPETGLIVGRYRLVRRLAIDDAGSLFLAVDVYTGHSRQLRVLWAGDASDETRRMRFVSVANEIASVVGEYDHGVDRGNSYIAYDPPDLAEPQDQPEQAPADRAVEPPAPVLIASEEEPLELDPEPTASPRPNGRGWLVVLLVVLLVLGAFALGRAVG